MWVRDLRYGVRTLRRRPGFAAVAVGMLALGIGMNGAVFTVVDAALFRGFAGVERNERIVQITTTRNFIYYPDFEEWRAQARSFAGMALVRGVFHTLSDGGVPETCYTTEVTEGTFGILGVRPMLGRDFAASDEQAGAEPVVILRYELWMRRFGGEPAAIGRYVRIDGVSTRVIGVMPKGFTFPSSQDLWTPLIPTAAALRRETGYAQNAYARLADGVGVEKARAEMEGIGRRLARAFPGTNREMAPVVRGFGEWFVGTDAKALYRGLWGAVVFVLLIVCANVANLLVAQAMGRSREIWIRVALGSGRWGIVRQFVAEGLVLSVLGGVIGWWVAEAGVRAYVLAQGSEGVLNIAMDGWVLGYLIAISIGTGIAAGLGTAGYVTARGMRGRRMPAVFVGVEMMLAVVLLSGAAVLSRSFLKVYTADVGADTRKVLMMDVYSPPERFASAEARRSYYRELVRRVEAAPGVESASFGPAPTYDVPRVAYEAADSDSGVDAATGRVGIGKGYFATLGARVVAGREFDDRDGSAGSAVAIVNQEFARRNWPGESAVGKRLRLGGSEWLTVVGVVSNIVQNDRTRQAVAPLVYVPGLGGFVFVRAKAAPASVAGVVKRAVYALDPTLPAPLWVFDELLERNYGFERNVTVLFVVFGLAAVLLATVGLYASMSHSVSGRVQEIGIRVAVGATARDVLKLVLRQGMAPVAVGLGVGLAISVALNRLLEAQLVGVSPADPVSMGVASGVLVVAAALGCWIPARRAMRVEPAVALKRE